MSEALICQLPSCGSELMPPKTKFCCRAHAQKFHNDARQHDTEKARSYQKTRRDADPEAARQRQRDYYAKNADQIAGRQKAYYHSNKEKYQAINKQSYEKYPFQGALASARSRSTKFGYVFELDWEWAKAVWTGKCAITGIPFVRGNGAGPCPYSATLDRIEPSAGYTKDNSRFVLMGVNALKGRGTDADMYAIAEAIVAVKPSTN